MLQYWTPCASLCWKAQQQKEYLDGYKYLTPLYIGGVPTAPINIPSRPAAWLMWRNSFCSGTRCVAMDTVKRTESYYGSKYTAMDGLPRKECEKHEQSCCVIRGVLAMLNSSNIRHKRTSKIYNMNMNIVICRARACRARKQALRAKSLL